MVGGKGAPDAEGVDRKDRFKGFKELHVFLELANARHAVSGTTLVACS